MCNPFDDLNSKLDQVLRELHLLRNQRAVPPEDELGGVELAMRLTGLARRSIYKLTHRREIPHRRVRGRLYFRRVELEQWLDAGRRRTAAEIAVERMSGNN